MCNVPQLDEEALFCLVPVHEEVCVSDPSAYYSCDDSLPLVEKTTEGEQGLLYSPDQLPISSCGDSLSHQPASSSYLEGTSVNRWFDIVKEKVERRNIHSMAKMLIALLVRLATFCCTVRFEFWRKPNNVHRLHMMESNTNSHSKSTAPEVVNEEDHVLPCIERLQQLEKAFEELSNKPAGIPIEKEKMLIESLDRIKSVELDLDKTMQVLHTIVMKRLEIAELLENIRESKCHAVACLLILCPEIRAAERRGN